MAKKKSRPNKGRKKYQIELTSLSIFLWGFCLFFLLAWIFVLGILAGRGFLPDAVMALSELKGQITKLQEMISHKKSHDLRSRKSTEPDPKLAFYEKLSSKKDEAKKRARPEGIAKVPKKAPLKKKLATSQKTMSERKEKEAIEGQHREPARLNSETQYSVQLASLEDKANAEKMVRQLIDLGYPAYFYEAKVKGKTYFRIRSGRFMNREEAKVYADKLAKKVGIKGFVSRIE